MFSVLELMIYLDDDDEVIWVDYWNLKFKYQLIRLLLDYQSISSQLVGY
jgi:hypothetical protein